jgi:hypothetical protein
MAAGDGTGGVSPDTPNHTGGTSPGTADESDGTADQRLQPRRRTGVGLRTARPSAVMNRAAIGFRLVRTPVSSPLPKSAG